MNARHQAITIAAALALFAGACSSGDDDTAGNTPDGTVAATTTTAPAPETTAPPPETTTPTTEPAVATSAVVETTVVETTTTLPEPECPPAVPNTATQPTGIVAAFDREAYQIAEGVAVDKSGNVYVSLPPLGQILRFAPGSSEYEVFGTIPGWDLAPDEYIAESFGILGLAIDEAGHVYAAVDRGDFAGVWKFDCRTAEATRFAGTETMLFANALTFDEAGNLYVTESFSGMEGDITLGAIWRITPDGVAEKWIENTTLGGPNRFNQDRPNGANGIAYNDGLLYVMVLQQTSVFTVPILADGGPGEITPYVVTENKFIGDGIALDVDGRVYSTDIITNGVIRINADGTIDPIASGAEAGFDQATSIAFGIGGTGLTLYAANLAGGSYEPSDTPGPALVAIDVDTPGRPLP